MYSNVLVGTDERRGSRDAVALARTLSPRCRRLTFAHVRNSNHPGQRGCAPVERAAEQEFSLELLGKLADELAPDAELMSVAASSVGDGLKTAAEKLGADLIVVGSCHRSRIGSIVNGNDTLSVLHRAPCAVAVAPLGYADTPAAVRTIGVAYDGSSQSKIALIHAGRLARRLDAKITALDIEQTTVNGYGWAAPSRENEAIELANARQRIGDLEGVELSVVIGLRAAELERFGEEVDVLVCGSRELGPVSRVMRGSTSDDLVRHARSPLLVVPAAAERTSETERSQSLSPTAA